MEKLMSARDVSKSLGINVFTLYLWARKNIIPSVRLGPKLIRFRKTDIEKLITSQKAKGSPGHGKSAD